MTIEAELIAEVEAAVDETVKEVTTETTTEEVTSEVETQKSETQETEEIIDAGDTDQGSGEDAEGDTTEEAGEDSGEKAEVTVPQISDQALTRAVQAGIPLDDARTFQSEGALLHTVSLIEAGRKTETETETEEKFFEVPKLDPEVYEPEVIEMFDKVNEQLRQQDKQIKELTSNTQQSMKAAQGAAEREVEEWFDGKCNGLGDDFTEALGKGSVGSLAQGSPQLAKRQKLATQVGVIQTGYIASGLEPPPRDETFKVAAQLILQEEYQKIHDKELTKKLAKRSGQHISRAGGQQASKSQSADDATAELLDKKYGKS